MNNVNKTLYIPLYGKALVSKKGIILEDKKAEYIWEKERFELKGKSKSKWLAYYMAMRSRVFDDWVCSKLATDEDCVILHIGCGMDSRCCRVSHKQLWFDIDFEAVIEERKQYFEVTDNYSMVVGDFRKSDWLNSILTCKKAIVLLEGISMYLTFEEFQQALLNVSNHFDSVDILMDCYTVFAAKASKYKNPINDVGVTQVYGIDDPKELEKSTGLTLVKEHDLTPAYLIDELEGLEKIIFKKLYAGNIAHKMYRLYEFKK